MINRRFIKINSIVTLIAFVLSLFASSIPMAKAAEGDGAINASAITGNWNVKTPKGEFQTQATGGYEKWADGKQRFVLRDTLGHLVSWGEAKIEKLTGSDFKVSVKDSEGTFETTKMLNTPETASQVSAAPTDAAAAPVAPKTTLGQKLSALKTKVTTPIEGGGKDSASWEKGYNFGKDTPGNLVSKIKGIFHKNTTTTPAASSSANTASAAATTDTAAAPAAPQSSQAAAKTSLGEKLSALKTKVTTPIEGGGKDSASWEKGYNFGKDAPTKVVNKVTGIFKKDASANTAAATETSPTAAATETAAPAIQKSVSSSANTSATAPTETATTTAAPKTSIGEKLSALKTKVTTPIEGGGKDSSAWEKGYSFGKDAPTKVVDKVTGIFKKDASANTAAATETSPTAAATETAASAKPAVEAAAAPAAGDASAAPKSTLGQKLSALKEKVTTPVEGGGKGSEAWEKGYKFGKETPEKVVDKVKGVFKKDDASAAAPKEDVAASASKEKTPSQKLSDTKDAKVEFNEKTGQFEKAPVAPKVPSKLSTALGAGKDSLKSSFSVRNIAMSAGLTVGFKIFEQIKSGQPVSIGKAVGYLATGEFAGSFVGSSLGSAAGSVVGSLVGSSIPVVGPIIGAFMPAIFGAFGGSLGAQMGNDLSAGQMPSFRKAIASIDKVAVLGQAVGSTVGAAIGSMLLPGIGSIVGGIVGGMIGNLIVNKIRGRVEPSTVSSVNVATHQVIFNEQLPPPPASQPTATSSIGGGSASGDLYGSMVAAYKQYSQLLAEGKGETAEGQQSLSQYKQLYTQYANSIQK